MEKGLVNLVKKYDNFSLVDIKDEIRKKLFETFDYCKYSEKLEREEINFFRSVSGLIDDKEFDKLLNIYINLLHIRNLFIEIKDLVNKD